MLYITNDSHHLPGGQTEHSMADDKPVWFDQKPASQNSPEVLDSMQYRPAGRMGNAPHVGK